MGTETNHDDRNTPEYLAQLLKDKQRIQAFPNVFLHMERILDEEINKVRVSVFNMDGTEPICLPEPLGDKLKLTDKIFVPIEKFPQFNFIGKILGPRGTTAQTLEKKTGCKIMIRGKNSMRNKEKEESLRGRPGWEHLDEPLHVLITVEDTQNRAQHKMDKAMDEVHKLLVPVAEGEDTIKKVQLIELAMMNGTYRDNNLQAALQAQLQQAASPMDAQVMHGLNVMQHRLVGPPLAALQQSQLRSPTPAGAPLMLAPPRMTVPTTGASFPPPLISPTDSTNFLTYPGGNPYEAYHSPYGLTPTLVDYSAMMEASAAGAVKNLRQAVNVRQHPYNRLSLA